MDNNNQFHLLHFSSQQARTILLLYHTKENKGTKIYHIQHLEELKLYHTKKIMKSEMDLIRLFQIIFLLLDFIAIFVIYITRESKVL